MQLGHMNGNKEPSAQMDVPGLVLTGVGQMLAAAARKQAHKKKSSADNPWQPSRAQTAISSFFELLCAYPGG